MRCSMIARRLFPFYLALGASALAAPLKASDEHLHIIRETLPSSDLLDGSGECRPLPDLVNDLLTFDCKARSKEDSLDSLNSMITCVEQSPSALSSLPVVDSGICEELQETYSDVAQTIFGLGEGTIQPLKDSSKGDLIKMLLACRNIPTGLLSTPDMGEPVSPPILVSPSSSSGNPISASSDDPAPSHGTSGNGDIVTPGHGNEGYTIPAVPLLTTPENSGNNNSPEGGPIVGGVSLISIGDGNHIYTVPVSITDSIDNADEENLPTTAACECEDANNGSQISSQNKADLLDTALGKVDGNLGKGLRF